MRKNEEIRSIDQIRVAQYVSSEQLIASWRTDFDTLSPGANGVVSWRWV